MFHWRPVLLLTATLSVTVLAAGSSLQAQSARVTIAVDAALDRHAIDPNIYGVAFATQDQLSDLNVPLNRSGGNTTTRYNWQQNASNHASDWYFESLADDGTGPGASADAFVSATKGAGAQAMLTIPTIGWVAKLGAGGARTSSFSIAKYGAQTDSDWQWFPDAGNGIRQSTGQAITGNDPNDASTPSDSSFQQGWVNHLIGQWGSAAAGGVRYYILDNEPSIWFSTHRDVHPAGPAMEEIRDKILDYGAKVKAAEPNAVVAGPEEWGWSGYLFSGYDQQWGSIHGWSSLPDRTAHGNIDYLPWLLDQLHQNNVSTGKRLLDVFTVHYYPQGGEFSNDTSATMQSRRNRSTRSLWDPNYTDETWIADKVKLIPRLKQWVSTYYPGTKTGITEYNWGAEGHINGATTQADVWGIFGREGLDLAARWTTPASSTPTYKAMKLYRNYDGSKSGFGDTSVRCTAPNPDQLSAFGALRSSDGALTVMAINKAASTAPITLSLANFNAQSTAQAWQLTSSNSITHLAPVAVSGGSLLADLPAQSITLFVVSAGTLTAPPAPTGVAATPGDGQVALSWNASTGAASYAVKRGTASGGPYVTVAPTVTGTSYTDAGLANGTRYYYVVTATNTAGTSGNSAEVSAVPVSATPPPPAVPANVTATAGNGRVDLSWSASSGATSYSVKRATTSGGPYTARTTGLAGTGYADTGLTNGTIYYYVVTASNAGGESANSTEASAQPTATDPTFTSTAAAKPTSVTHGKTVTLTATFTCATSTVTGGVVDLEIYDPAGNKVAQQFWTPQDFATAQARSYSYAWVTPRKTGTYTVKLGVFGKDWAPIYHWNDRAVTFQVK